MADVIKGKENWLFLDNDTNKVLDQISGRIPASKMDWDKISRCLIERVKLAELYGFKYLHLIAPNAHCFAKEFLPDGISISDDRSAVYMEKLFPDIVMYPLDLLRSNRDKYILYYKTDTHWTQLAVALVFNEISKKLNLDTSIDIDIPKEMLKKRDGDLGIKLSHDVVSVYQKLIVDLNVKVISTNNVGNTGNYVHLRSDNRNGKRCVIFGDSFLHDFLDVVAYYFEETYFFWQAGIFDANIIRQLQPDIVINETAERFFNGEFDSRSYYDVLVDKIMSYEHNHLNEINLDDSFYSNSFRKFFYDYRKLKEDKGNFVFLGRRYVEVKDDNIIFEKNNIVLKKINNNFNLYRYDIPSGKGVYSVVVNDVEVDFSEYTIGVFDFKVDKMICLENYSAGSTAEFSFAIGNDEAYSLVVFAGLYGQTANKSMVIGEFNVYYASLDRNG